MTSATSRPFTDDQLGGARRIREILWTSYAWLREPEDKKIRTLQEWCIRACGDVERGMQLATEAIWS